GPQIRQPDWIRGDGRQWIGEFSVEGSRLRADYRRGSDRSGGVVRANAARRECACLDALLDTASRCSAVRLRTGRAVRLALQADAVPRDLRADDRWRRGQRGP